MKRAGTPGRTEGVVTVVLMGFPVVGSICDRGYAAGAATLLPVACRRLLRLVVADADTGRLLEKRTFRRCLPVAAMMGMGRYISGKTLYTGEGSLWVKSVKSLES